MHQLEPVSERWGGAEAACGERRGSWAFRECLTLAKAAPCGPRRPRAARARCCSPLATGLTDAEWAIVAPFLPAPARTVRPRRWRPRATLDAILHVLRTGGAWRHLPRERPPWPTVHRWFLRLSRAGGAFERLAHALALADRERAGREASPTAAVLDARAGGALGRGGRGRGSGFAPARRVVGRKRRALTDTDGRCSWPRPRPPTCTTAAAAWLRARATWPV
jgi:transposase